LTGAVVDEVFVKNADLTGAIVDNIIIENSFD
jgi:hypothetical protein